MDGSQSQFPDRPAFRAETTDDLRELIAQAELIVANLRGAGTRALMLLFLLDTIRKLFATLQEMGVDLRAEAVRIETVERLLLAKDSVLVREMRRLGGLAKVREAAEPAPDQWWWYLDQHVAERQRQQVRRGLLICGAAAAIFLVASLLYNYVFPPDPRRVAVMEKSSQAERALMEGDLAGALALYREAAEIMPDDPEVQVWVGVLAEKLGDGETAAQAYAAAEGLSGGRARFLTLRGMTRIRMGDTEQAKADAEAALAIEPDAAETYLLLGNVYESEGDVAQAMAAFEKTAELAGQANNSALIVLAKTRLGMLLQSAPMMAPPDETPGPTPSS